MAEGETKPESSPSPATPPAPGPGAPSSGTGFDFKALPLACLRILKCPAGSLEALYRPGKPALFQGLAIGGGAALLIPLLQIIFLKMSNQDIHLPAGEILKQCLGGLAFLATGVGLSFLLRGTLGKSPTKDWQDDVYLFGSALLFLIAGVIGGGFLSLIHESFFQQLGGATITIGLLLTAFTYAGGLQRVAKVDPGRAAWVCALTIGGALVVGGLLNFSLKVGMERMATEMFKALEGQMRGMEGMFRGFPR